MEIHQGVFQEYENTDPHMFDLLLKSPSLMDAWVLEVSERIEVTPEVVKKTVEVISARENKDIDSIVRLAKTNSESSEDSSSTVDPQWEIDSWAIQEQELIRRNIAIAYLRRRRLEKENITYAAVAQWMPTDLQIASVFPLIEMPTLLKINNSSPSGRNFGMTKRENIRQGVLISEIKKSLIHFNSKGATKTQILRYINKDTSRWRTSFESVIQSMIDNQSVYKVKVGRNELYYGPQYHEIVIENDIHRKIYEHLRHNPSTQTSLVKLLTYNNSKGHRIIKDALGMLSNVGLIINNGVYWSILDESEGSTDII